MSDIYLHPAKAELVERAIARWPIRSLIDAGACWGVHGGYTFQAIASGRIERAYILDSLITERTRERAAAHPYIEMREGQIGEPAFLAELPKCDAVIMFDVLLHQAAPDWRAFLAGYADKADYFLIWNQNWIGTESIRFIDRGADWYAQHILPDHAEAAHQWFAVHDQMHPTGTRLWRDVHTMWQWGITARDLVDAMHGLSFRLEYFCNHGPYSSVTTPDVQVEAFLFSRR